MFLIVGGATDIDLLLDRASHLASYLQTKKINIVYRLIRDNIQRETVEIKNGDIIFVKSRFFGQVSRLEARFREFNNR